MAYFPFKTAFHFKSAELSGFAFFYLLFLYSDSKNPMMNATRPNTYSMASTSFLSLGYRIHRATYQKEDRCGEEAQGVRGEGMPM